MESLSDPNGRYAKQVLFHGVGAGGQERLLQSRVAVVGLGALGSVIAEQMCRAGVGYLRLIDRDFVELGNLQRQTLYSEADAEARLPKAVAAAERLRAVNSTVTLELRVADVTSRNVEELLEGCDLVLDGTDNLETRLLLNDACLQAGRPWVHGGALGSTGSVMAVVPGETACLRCLLDPVPPPGALRSCDTEGVLAATTGVVASLEVALALRRLAGHDLPSVLVSLDVWEPDLGVVEVQRRPDCPACGEGRYEYLNGERVSWTTVLCGRNSVQVEPSEAVDLPLDALARRLAAVGRVTNNGYLLTLEVGAHELVIFPTGRTIVRGTTDESEARTLYARYVGT